MSTAIFSFLIERPFNELRGHRTTQFAAGSDFSINRPERGSRGLYTANGTVRLPGNSLDVSDWDAFLEARQGAYDTFLFSAHRSSLKSVTALSIGTGNGTTTVFSFAHKFLNTTSLTVYVGGVEKTGGGADYTFSANYTAPIVTFGTAPSNTSAVTATFDYFYPVRFVGDPSAEDEDDLHLTSDVTTSHYRYSFTVVEDGVDAHRV